MNTIINDIFSRYEVRKTKKQKTAFIEYTEGKAEELGYTARIEKGIFGTRNIVVGDPDTAKVIYTAHYDTCPRLPFPNFLTPLNFGIYLLYNLVLLLAFFAIAFLIGFVFGCVGALLSLDGTVVSVLSAACYLLLLVLLLFGPANKHTANDNTSGITVLFGIMKALPAEQREKAAFVFFDNEEIGLIGSASFAGKHKSIKANTLLINFDCVSDGKELLLVAKKKAKVCKELLSRAYAGDGAFAVRVTDKAFYPSDQANFKKGVGVAVFQKTKRGTLYINKIHTKKDTVYQRENIDFLIDGSLKLTELL